MKESAREIRWFLSGLMLLLIGLKLGGVLPWSWWLVFSPFLIPLCFTMIVGVVAWAYIMWIETPEARNARQLQSALRAYSKALRME